MKIIKIATVVGGITYMFLFIGPRIGVDGMFWTATTTFALAIYGLLTILEEFTIYAWSKRKKSK